MQSQRRRGWIFLRTVRRQLRMGCQLWVRWEDSHQRVRVRRQQVPLRVPQQVVLLVVQQVVLLVAQQVVLLGLLRRGFMVPQFLYHKQQACHRAKLWRAEGIKYVQIYSFFSFSPYWIRFNYYSPRVKSLSTEVRKKVAHHDLLTEQNCSE